MVQVKRIVNHPITSNCFVVWNEGQNDCLVVDPGDADGGELAQWLADNDKTVRYIVLTHHHFDHIWGVNRLREQSPQAEVVCSTACAEMVIDRKKNCSLYHNGVGFVLGVPQVVFGCELELMLGDERIAMAAAPGHSASGILVEVGGNLFAGDTLIKDVKTVTKLRTASGAALRDTLERIKQQYVGRGLIVRAGHGPSFELDKYNIDSAL